MSEALPAELQTTRAGALLRLGIGIAILALLADQASKLWLIYGFDLGERGRFSLFPWFDLVLTWNTGISYGLFSQDTAFGRWVLVAFKIAAVIFLTVWLWRSETKLTAASLGLIIGGALGNVIDRFLYGAVADFAFFHIDKLNFYWYVFNLADVAIVAGVIGLLYETLFSGSAAKAPR
ncbi:lipoprotein signal peptidase [Variibacter gotjawalensis]|uniref:Lipoprotein signal peptidase n=1 Tax=Variibacter gotjawalensis TaxID=1333996 RepID=A0A0S3PQQ0_9BRAD|nr:signal peptidase II [Variibacter gotjawalensis]NIK48591.1 signal peptidase II [Variibacter gotjawalensis]RZS50456.1 signal peptidase II [Variibacter gotjawalensis]BAT58290.1 lipoprotein signal peptidase [Variibacter gotjawalensis]